MQFEVIIPLIAYLVVVFGLSLYAMRNAPQVAFLMSTFSAAARWAASCWP
ncbi:sodium/panthothenate symporter [Klebsiella pneumoniae]|nr:sodium/panthothenate symporter [Klebsiella pneumoniae]